jgi:hypothetical protein
MNALSFRAAAELAALREESYAFDGAQVLPTLYTLLSNPQCRKFLREGIEGWLTTAVGSPVHLRRDHSLDGLLRLLSPEGGCLIDRAEFIRAVFMPNGRWNPGWGPTPTFVSERMTPYLQLGTIANYDCMLAAYLERHFREPERGRRFGRIHFARWPRPSQKSWMRYSAGLEPRIFQRLPTIEGRDWRDAYRELFRDRLSTHLSDATLGRRARRGRELHSGQIRLHLVSLWIPGVGLPPLKEYEESDRWHKSMTTRQVDGLTWYEHWHHWRLTHSLMDDRFVRAPLSTDHFSFMRFLNLHGFKTHAFIGAK